MSRRREDEHGSVYVNVNAHHLEMNGSQKAFGGKPEHVWGIVRRKRENKQKNVTKKSELEQKWVIHL